jgi:hypothetical protein
MPIRRSRKNTTHPIEIVASVLFATGENYRTDRFSFYPLFPIRSLGIFEIIDGEATAYAGDLTLTELWNLVNGMSEKDEIQVLNIGRITIPTTLTDRFLLINVICAYARVLHMRDELRKQRLM